MYITVFVSQSGLNVRNIARPLARAAYGINLDVQVGITKLGALRVELTPNDTIEHLLNLTDFVCAMD